MLEKINIFNIVQISIKAGNEIIKIYNTDFNIESKQDKSPLTLADKRSHELIASELKRLYPEIPLLSEEGKGISYDERKNWDYFWLVDPLDGTKEFIKRNGEFTVNIALIHRNKPVIGVIYAPVLDTVYFAKKDLGSYKLTNCKEFLLNGRDILSDKGLVSHSMKLPISKEKAITTVIASRSHMSKETEDYINKLRKEVGEVEIISAGSSLKLCYIAEGKADVYPRFAPTMEWDTAAGQAIVEQANGIVVDVETNEKLEYNKENLLNPWFIVKR
ncbi:3'(2'),5'-bisphosphate nucleotidase [Vulcanibacillus modesticaldus]|uniref:3'(2'),5'-bisphosphate nucleotidase CysQ n=1 Tax=Vulcanibacillus modesticaldus TaxID=337097 RepID=A0A1D2YVM8_9BACI|nr:3'(2'),5'-bisphosphate nucleotidase CysQ [Vulcanibacillus modesticaldus]OEF99780.1 3'(2'),5'-bisphosphate nucleotidase [Vulcanibacillus modesticaldus]